MDHNLEDSLNLESAISEMDFEHAGDVVVSQDNINLDTQAPNQGIPMEFEHIEEQPLLMDTANEEIIDFMGDQFSIQEYSVQDDQTTTATTIEESNQQSVLTSQGNPLINLQFESQSVAQVRQEAQTQPKYIAVKAAPMRSGGAPVKKQESPSLSAPRQIAIAPKPPKLVPTSKAFPVALVSNKTTYKIRQPISGVIQGGKGNTVLAQIGKQLVVMPSTQKIKLVTSGSSSMSNVQYIRTNSGQAQLITTKSGLQTPKPIMAKVIVQGQSNVEPNNQTVITKILPSTSAVGSQARYVMQQKTVPIPLNKKVLVASPTKQGVKFAKKQQIIAIKSPTPKLMPAPVQAPATKKLVISANPNQNVILKTTAPPKTAQMTKDGKVIIQGQKSQLHQINVPGKGIQYIRLITNQTATTSKTVSKPQVSSATSKQYVLTDNKGNLIQMSSEKVMSAQPPPLVFTGNAPGDKWKQKLVRIAAAPMKSGAVTSVTSRSAQSLLAPLSPRARAEDAGAVLVPSDEVVVDHEAEVEDMEHPEGEYATIVREPAQDRYPSAREEGVARAVEARTVEPDSKASLRALIADAAGAGAAPDARDVEVKFEPRAQVQDDEDAGSMSPLEVAENLEEQLIVIPSNFVKTDHDDSVPEYAEEEEAEEEAQAQAEAEAVQLSIIGGDEDGYLTPRSPLPSTECDMVTSELGLRPRRACNCTKSQCLKLYCDCFANGEFCNRCNCNNCYNNLDYEELRQKAIRACLERNPNAFRPKIGKSKVGGPEIIRRHNKGCNCKRSGCLKNYCECYEAKIACTAMCKCFGCRNVEETLHRRRREPGPLQSLYRPPPLADLKQPCSFMTSEVIEAVCQCLLAACVDGGGNEPAPGAEPDPVRDVIDEYSRCLQDIISASHQAGPIAMLDEGHT